MPSWRIGDIFEERVQLDGTRDGAFEFDVDARVGIRAVIPHEPRADGLHEGVIVRAAQLQHVADAPVEVVLVSGAASEGQQAHLQHVVHELRDRSVQSLYHGPEVLADLEVAERVIVVVEKSRDERDESVERCPVREAVPEDQLRVFGVERREAIAAPGGDEVDGVVAVPVLEPVLPHDDDRTGLVS